MAAAGSLFVLRPRSHALFNRQPDSVFHRRVYQVVVEFAATFGPFPAAYKCPTTLMALPWRLLMEKAPLKVPESQSFLPLIVVANRVSVKRLVPFMRQIMAPPVG